jgi:conjugal transfer ATP-binding protein TraC
VARLCVDPWNYWINTSAGDEVYQFNQLIAQGKTPLESIATLSGIKL